MTLMAIVLAAGAWAAAEGEAIAWTPLKVQVSAFSPELGMLDAERDEYATNLANIAVSGFVHAGGKDKAAMERAQRLLALALNLSPRNRRAVVVNYQLGQGTLPAEVKGDYSAPSLARLLLTRGQLLAKTERQENRLLARMFFQLAAELDPKNEDAVYASEVDRLDHGNLDWGFLTRKAEAAAPEAVRPPEPRPERPPVREEPTRGERRHP